MHASRIVALSAFSLALVATAASAEESGGRARKDRVITLERIEIPGRVPLPHVVVDIARVVHKAPLAELKKPLAERIAAAVEKDPF